MVEIHYHLLHRVDDGPDSLDAAVALAEASIDSGVTHIVSTPHCNEQFEFNAARNHERIAELEQRLGSRIQLGLGCDFHLCEENVAAFQKMPTDFTINSGKYLLVELSDFGIPDSIDGMLDEIIHSGFTPIITHPERNAILSSAQERLGAWRNAGCLIQITAGSVTGFFGTQVKKIAHEMLGSGCVHLVASDAHGLRSRPPALREAHEVIEKLLDVETADRLCSINPMAVFRSEPISEQPRPREAKTPRKESSIKRLSRFFSIK
jgi:protein-tyrosine phosphatase